MTAELRKGLDGVVVDTTAVSEVFPELVQLTYRGYLVHELAEACSFEEVAYLLWHGELPNARALAEFRTAEAAERALSPALLSVIRQYPGASHPMDTMRTSVSYMGVEDPETADNSDAANRRKAMRLLAKIPSALAADYRARKGLPAIAPDPKLSIAENFFHMCFGAVPPAGIVKAMDVSLVLYAEHGFNASTFTARVIASSLADMHAAVTGAIGSLKGPLHGGANEAVMHMLQEIGEPARAASWLAEAFARKRLVMGFGHRIYKKGDSRVPTMKKYYLQMAKLKGETKLPEISRILEETMVGQKGIYPNLDFPTGPAYYLMGIPIDFFTPIFVASRITGWTAHVLEQHADNRLIRPKSQYVGEPKRAVPPLAARA